jgi:hypothetical protein
VRGKGRKIPLLPCLAPFYSPARLLRWCGADLAVAFSV